MAYLWHKCWCSIYASLQQLQKPIIMGQMKWIYTLIEDGRVDEFKLAYETALHKKLLVFEFDGKQIDIIKAGSIMKVMQKGLQEYNDHLDEMADRHEAEMMYWKQVQDHLNS